MGLTSAALYFSVLSGGISLGYIVFGIYLPTQYEGVGVKSLSVFSILWGLNLFVASTVIVTLTNHGYTSAAQIQSVSLPSVTRAILIGSAPLSGLLTASGVFAWLWFTLRYTRGIGDDEWIVIVLLGGVTSVIVTVNGFVGVLSSFGIISIDQSLRVNFHSFVSVLEVLTTGLALGVGTALLYATATDYRPFRSQAVVGLSFSVIALWIIQYLYQFGLVTGFGAIGILRVGALFFGLIGLWSAVNMYELFDQLPASRAVGRQTAFDTSDTAIIVLNDSDQVSDLNPAAQDLFEARSHNIIGSSLDSLLPDSVNSETLKRPQSMTFRLPASNKVIEAVTAVATNKAGQSIGKTIVCTDITSERRRQQRIQVLNRVLRHNLRNDLNTVRGYVKLITSSGKDPNEYEDQIIAAIDRLLSTGNKAQELEKILEIDPFSESQTPLAAIIYDAIERTSITETNIPITVEIPSNTIVWINPILLQLVIRELIENTIQHTTQSKVSVIFDSESSILSVSDTGSGIPEHEINAINNPQETQLEHGSGLGLWLIKWGIEMFDGSVTFDTDSSGTTVHIRLPREHIGSVDTE